MVVRFLRACLAISATLLVVGLVLSLAAARGWMRAGDYPTIAIRAGLGLLIAIPALNLAGMLASAFRRRDWMTTTSIVVVLATLAFNIVWMAR